jgi:hypothetical protein
MKSSGKEQSVPGYPSVDFLDTLLQLSFAHAWLACRDNKIDTILEPRDAFEIQFSSLTGPQVDILTPVQFYNAATQRHWDNELLIVPYAGGANSKYGVTVTSHTKLPAPRQKVLVGQPCNHTVTACTHAQ